MPHGNPWSEKIPFIDLGIVDDDVSGQEGMEELVRWALETFGFVQVVNHKIALFLLEDMLEGVHNFNELELAVKMKYCMRDLSMKVLFNSKFDLFESQATNWRDTFFWRIHLWKSLIEPLPIIHESDDFLLEAFAASILAPKLLLLGYLR
ncbi:hypothetical protein KSP40_PGU014763 [Platanthera guangdongensis]|uniref:Non-haem dioxygenase N-terminal domain-containing protein n=1 Tax=Platanthera guangdongensis TaxID=2320717 RepID=A0ABR2LFY2_9ASPA